MEPTWSPQQVLRRRRKYVASACASCQSRKVKCSGERPCVSCRESNLSCEYRSGRRRRAAREPKLPAIEPEELQGSAPPLDKERDQSQMMQMIARISELECSYTALLEQIKSATVIAPMDTPSSSWRANSDEDADSTFATLPERVLFRAPTSIIEQISTLNESIAREPMAQLESRPESRAPSPAAVTWSNMPRGLHMSLGAVEKETRLNNSHEIRRSVHVFFAYLNPHYPCLNENTFRPLLDQFLKNDDADQVSYADGQQFIALLNLIHAEVRVLSDEWPTSVQAPAWEEFCRAESILSRLTWLGNGNLMTIQCLLIKTRYLLYAEKPNGAYDTMGRVVRLCWQLGLHCQPSWVGLSDFDVVMRQQIFWTAFYLDRHVALLAGLPYLIRECDINVHLPPNVDDKLLFPDQPLPPLRLEGGPVNPYLSSAVAWASVTSEIWDAVYGTNALKPTSPELIATMDARIKFKQSQIPEVLQWSTNCPKLDGLSHTPHYMIRQSAILNQRMNLLRLLLRQHRMSNLNFDNAMARDAVSIASGNIDSIEEIYNSPLHIPLDRFSSCVCVAASLQPLICVIVKYGSDPKCRSDAIGAYNKAIFILKCMAPTFSAARHALMRMSKLLRTTERAIRRFDLAEQFPSDPAEFEIETLIPQISDFFGYPDPQQDWDFDLLSGNLDIPFTVGN